jgi:hypothetical protein
MFSNIPHYQNTVEKLNQDLTLGDNANAKQNQYSFKDICDLITP